MTNVLKLAALCLALLSLAQADTVDVTAPVPAPAETGSALISNAVTVDGTGIIRVQADTCRLEFILGASAPTASAAYAKLKKNADAFSNVMANITDPGPTIVFYEPSVMRSSSSDTGEPVFDVTQKAVARAANFPTDRVGFVSWMSGVTASVADAGILAREIPQPAVFYEVSKPVDIEGQLMEAAVRDATKRIEIVAKSLDRRLNRVRTAYFPTTVSVGGKSVEISDALRRLEGDALNVPVTYTIQVSYALEE